MKLMTGSGFPAPEPWRTIMWRFDELRKAGYTVEAALDLSERPDVDLHRACDLVLRGCPVEQAVEILR